MENWPSDKVLLSVPPEIRENITSEYALQEAFRHHRDERRSPTYHLNG